MDTQERDSCRPEAPECTETVACVLVTVAHDDHQVARRPKVTVAIAERRPPTGAS